jgi:CheY-like chemotaxis protein
MKKPPQIIREYMPYGRVLVVDDMEINLYVARGLMAPYGLSIETVASGFEVIDKIKNGAVYDIIFMDHYMPKMDGVETTKNIRELGYTKPIIALTANALSGQAQMFLENGFDNFISKPIDIRQLDASLNELIRDKCPPETLETARRQAAIFAESGAQPLSNPEMAGIFARDAEKVIERLNMIHEKIYRRNDDIRMFVIDVHAMKSALANIGESELSAVALRLEQIGRERDTTALLAETPAFLESLRKVVEKINQKDEDEEIVNDISDDERIFLHEKLFIIETACTAYDGSIANEALAELRQKTWPRPIRELLETIAGQLLHSDFAEAANLANDYQNHAFQGTDLAGP